MASEVDTLIVGGSAAGLAVARCLQELGHDATVLDAAPAVGSMWRNAYERLHLHTPRALSGLPHLPMPASYPRYPSRAQVVAYLETYAAALKRPVQTGRKVLSVTRSDRRWLAATAAENFVCRTVVIATGNTRVPNIPAFDGLDSFAGTVLHSSAYRTAETFRGRRVLVVGFGNSATEIGIDLCEHGAHPTLAVRGPVNVIPRDILGIPILAVGVLESPLPARVADAINGPLLDLLVGDITRYGLRKLPYGVTAQIRQHQQSPVLDIGAMALIRSGDIAVRGGMARFTPTGVVFDDGRSEPFDAVILGTGYRAAIGDILQDVPAVLDADGNPRVSGAASAESGLYFCGFALAAGGMLRQIGIEAHRIAALIAAGGSRTQPNP